MVADPQHATDQPDQHRYAHRKEEQPDNSGEAVSSWSSRVGWRRESSGMSPLPYRRDEPATPIRGDNTLSPPPPEKMLFVSDGTSSMPTHKRHDHGDGLEPVDPVLGLGDGGRQGRHEPEDELLKNHQERDGHDGDERILDERTSASPRTASPASAR